MLWEACKHFALENNVYAASRNSINLNEENIFHIKADYTRTDEFTKIILNAFEKKEFPSKIIIWMHASGDESLNVLLDHVITNRPDTKIFHIKGSGNFNPSKVAEIIISSINYFEIFLGFILGNGTSRWLTHEEISKGVIEAVEKEFKTYTIGVTEPWEKHP